MDESIKNIAGYLFEEDNGCANQFTASVLNNFFKIYNGESYIEEYRKRSYLQNKTVTYIKDGIEYSGIVQGIDDDFGLMLKTDEGVTVLTCGEVSVKAKS